ncbi:uncharacterized protein PRCAT00006209001 [Priceomyces carsonii]|uniref:uncharacterized protein n=1 Tax=Priceomyces carsonii TaxID=28549 RepID=UPI002ED81D7A|nr:unnamed protein product [Priceomyces carsonii]
MSASQHSLQKTPSMGKRHRHRRSAAISGDFDIMGLGLFSPPSTSGSSSVPCSTRDVEHSELDKHFQFNNKEDFTNRPVDDEFLFPTKTPELPTDFSPRNYTSPPRCANSSYGLNSPIKLNHKRSSSAHNTPSTRFFLTEETTMNNDNVPDAVIDLDEILESNLHIGNHFSSHQTGQRDKSHKRTELAPDFTLDDDFLASPFSRLSSGPFSSSPLSVPPNNLLHQTIQEQVSCSTEEDEEEESDLEFLGSDQEAELFTNPQVALKGLYSNSSANSSSTYLNNNRYQNNNNMIEKCLSNSSRESGPSATYNGTPYSSSKRSGAKANRYQSFYDQSYKISNALKISSSESINIVRSGSINSSIKDTKSLGHSSSLPSLKSHLKRNQILNPSKLGEVILPYAGMNTETRTLEEEKSSESANTTSNSCSSSLKNLEITIIDSGLPKSNSPILKSTHHGDNIIKPGMQMQSIASELESSNKKPMQTESFEFNYTDKDGNLPTSIQSKNHQVSVTSNRKSTTTSPVSVISSTVISTSGTYQLTDYSTLTVQDDLNLPKTTLAVTGDLYPENSEAPAPCIIISRSDDEACSMTNSTFKQDDEMGNGTKLPVLSKDNVQGGISDYTLQRSEDDSTQLSTGNFSFQEESLLVKSLRQISPDSTEPTNITHQIANKSEGHKKSKSFSTILQDFTPTFSKGSALGSSDSLEVRTKKRPSRYISWLKRR